MRKQLTTISWFRLLEDFQDYVHSNYKPDDKTPITSGDLNEFGQQVFYVLDAFCKHFENK